MFRDATTTGPAAGRRARLLKWLESGPGGVAAATVTGLLYAAGFDPLNLWPLGWVCLVPLFLALRRCSAPRGALLGGVAGAVGTLGSVYWLWLPLTRQYSFSAPLALVFLLGVATYVGAFYALVGALQARLEGWKLPASSLWVAALWVLGELLRARLGAGVPWLLAGHTQVRVLPVVQVADLGGVYAISFLVVAANRALAAWLGARRRAQGAIAGALVVVALAYGAFRMHAYRTPGRDDVSLRVAVVQPSIAQAQKWDREHFADGMRLLYGLSERALRAEGVSLVVWPETALTVDLERAGDTLAPVVRLLATHDAELLLGAPRILGNGDARQVRNAAALLRPDGVVGGRYDKQILLPFGEYYPSWVRGLPALATVVEEHMGPLEFTPGAGPTLLHLASGHQLGAPICYEATYPELVRGLVRHGAEVLINLTNDAWFEESAGAAQHLAMARLRAVEHRRPLLRAANTGISVLVLPDGRLSSSLGIGARDVMIVHLATGGGTSLYTEVGDTFALCCGAALALLALFGRVRRYFQAAG